jgi:hypothetical protein
VTVVPVQSAPIEEGSTVTLPRYAKIIGYPECQFFGVNNPDDLMDSECREIWLKPERDDILKYLAEAQGEIEDILHYSIGYKWKADERHPYGFPLLAKWAWVIEAGVRATSTISAGEAVSHLTDPAVIGPVATTVTDEDEIKVYYPATLVEEEIEIHPSDIDLAGGFVTIYVPRCRMVLPTLVDNDRTGIDYTDTTNFLQTVDVVREYNDASTNATLVWPHSCETVSACSCDDYTQDACIYVRSTEIGALDVLPATYSGGAWSATSCTRCGQPEYVEVNYRAGVAMTRQMEDMIVRLAHAKMPEEPCGCEIAKRLWRRDRAVPKVFTKERLNCPFGLEQGAWVAWKWANGLRVRRGGGL